MGRKEGEWRKRRGEDKEQRIRRKDYRSRERGMGTNGQRKVGGRNEED